MENIKDCKVGYFGEIVHEIYIFMFTVIVRSYARCPRNNSHLLLLAKHQLYIFELELYLCKFFLLSFI